MIKKILNAYIKNPAIIILFLIFYLFLVGIAKIPLPESTSPIFDYILLIVPRIILLAVYTIFLSIFIGSAHLALKKKATLKEALSFIKFTPGNFLLFLPLILVNILLIVVVGYIRLDIPNFYVIQAIAEIIIFVLIANFLLMSFFYHTLKKENVFKSLKDSIKNSHKIYLALLAIQLVYFVITIPVSFLPLIVQDILYFLILYPIITLILAYLFEHVQTK